MKEILLVEDDSFQEKIFRKILTDAANGTGCKITSLGHGEAALAYLQKKNKVKLVVLDLALPDLSGFGVLERLKKLRNKIPVIMLSAHEDKDLIIKAIKLGAHNFFVKGKNHSELEKFYLAVAEVLES